MPSPSSPTIRATDRPSVPPRSRLLFITTFGLGYLKPASGTWGSLPPVALAAAMIALDFGPAQTPLLFNAVLALVGLFFAAACLFQADAAEARFGKKDPGQVVADETAAQCIPLLFLPASAVRDWPHAAGALVGAFLLFRIFDIIKPWPARGLQRIPGGWGILIDDLFAGLYAAAIVQFLTRWTA